MVTCSYYNGIAREIVYLHEQRCDDSLDFTSFVFISSFLSNGIKFVEEENARRSPSIVEDALEAARRFTEVTTYQGFVADDQKGNPKRFGHGFGERGLAVTWGTDKQYAVAWLEAVRPQQIGALLLFN
jgi:hypothetical protein